MIVPDFCELDKFELSDWAKFLQWNL